MRERDFRHGTDVMFLACELLTRELASRGVGEDDMKTISEQLSEICPVFAKIFRDFYHDYMPAYVAALKEFG